MILTVTDSGNTYINRKETVRRAVIVRLAALLLFALLLTSCVPLSENVGGTTADATGSAVPGGTLGHSHTAVSPESTVHPGTTVSPETTKHPETTALPETTVIPETDGGLPDRFPLSLPSHSQEPIEHEVSGHSAFLLDLSDNTYVFFKGDGSARIYPASITKLLTALIALKYCETDEMFTVGDERAMVAADSSVAGLAVGDSLSLYELLHALLLPSGGDAAYTVAAGVGRILCGGGAVSAEDAIAAFTAEMNAYSRLLGMSSSNFTCPDGYHDDAHYSTLYDITLLAIAACNNAVISEIVKKTEYACTLTEDKTLTWRSSNKLLNAESEHYLECVTGLKTGTTDEAGCCLVASAIIGDRYYIAATFGAPTGAERFGDCAGLLNALTVKLS